MAIYSKDFFKLQLQFAQIISEKYECDFAEALFRFTSIYVRLLGFLDEDPPFRENTNWLKIVSDFPKNEDKQLEYIYIKYINHEKNRNRTPIANCFGCIFFKYHSKTNQYELHYNALEKESGLGYNRIQERLSDLKQLFETIQKEEKPGSTIFVRTWLLNIKAFQRLFPKIFIENAKMWDINLAQDNSHWGQFLDINGNVKLDLAEQLLTNAKSEYHENINSYFPLKVLISEEKTAEFYRFYNIDLL